MLKYISFFFFFSFLTLLVAPKISASEIEVFDSTDHYLGACQLTNESSWELKEDLNVSKFEVWYNWNQGETTLPVKVFREGELFAEFTATRGSCDPYQQLWCNADYPINLLFPKGQYTTEIPDARQCLKPGGTGAIRLYQNEEVSASPTDVPEPTPIPALTTSTQPPTPSCSCNQTQIILFSVAASALTSLIIFFVLKKLP